MFSSTNNSSGSSLFGNNNTTSNSGGLFGASNTNSSTTSTFGSTTPNNNSGGMFGNSTSSNNTSGGGLFGNSNTNSNASGGGLFGSSNNSNNNSGGGLFGNASNNNSSSGGGLFGNTSNNNSSSGGGLFGNTNSNSSGGLFGNTSNNNSSSGGGLFGNANSNSSGGLFGNTNNNNAGFGNSNQSFNNNNGLGQQNVIGQNQTLPWWLRELMTIEGGYRRGPGSKFQAMLYEVIGIAPDLLCNPSVTIPAHIDAVKANRKSEVQKLLPWIDQRQWEKAEEKNPDPVNWMPSPIDGIDSLYDRVKAQSGNVQEQISLLGSGKVEQEQKGEPLTKKSVWLENVDPRENFSAQIEQCKHEHIHLMQRLIKVMGRLERLQCCNAKGGRNRNEIEFGNRLKKVQQLLDDPRGCKAQLTQLAAQLQMSEQVQNHQTLALINTDDGTSATEDDEESFYNFLESQREGLEHLMNIVKKDTRDVQIMKAKIQPHIR